MYEFTETDSQGQIILYSYSIFNMWKNLLDMVPHKILKKLKLSEEKSVATVVADGDGNISKPNNR